MVTIRAWTPQVAKHWARRDDSLVITAPTTGQAMDKADAIGAVRVVDGLGTIYRKICGEWYSL